MVDCKYLESDLDMCGRTIYHCGHPEITTTYHPFDICMEIGDICECPFKESTGKDWDEFIKRNITKGNKYNLDASEPLNFKEPASDIFTALEKVYNSPSCLWEDYVEALDYIMESYKKYRENKSKPKIIFLDVDGVLNSYSDGFSHNLSSDWHLMLLKKLVAKSGAKIVVSSSWRILKHLQDTLAIRLKEFDMDIYDFTPDLKDRTCRGDEIKKWLDSHEHGSFVILDDESDMGPYTHSNLIKTNPETGLVEKDIKEALLILNEDMVNDLSIGGL